MQPEEQVILDASECGKKRDPSCVLVMNTMQEVLNLTKSLRGNVVQVGSETAQGQ